MTSFHRQIPPFPPHTVPVSGAIDDGHGWVVILTPHREREWPWPYLLVYLDRWWQYPDLEPLFILGFAHTTGCQ